MSRICFFAVTFATLLNGTLFGQANQTLTVMSYNILDGYERGQDQERKIKTAEFIRTQKPDVVAFQELVGFTADSLADFAQSFGHSYSILLKENGYPVGLTSTQPIALKAKILGNLWHGMLHASTHGIDFFVVHLSPHDVEIRQREARTITQYMEDNLVDQSHYIVLGDFNSLSPFDADVYAPNTRLLEYTREKDEERGKYVNLLDGQFDYSVMGRFLQFPLIDVIQRFIPEENRFTFPTRILAGNRLRTDEIIPLRRRLDYILVSRDLATKALSAKVINSGVVNELSDHFPVVAEFDWTGGDQD